MQHMTFTPLLVTLGLIAGLFPLPGPGDVDEQGLVGMDAPVLAHGGIIRMDTEKQEIYLTFTGHEFADGGPAIREALRKHAIKASFFFTGDFYRQAENSLLIRGLIADGHYLGAHSDGHLLYCAWENRDSLLVSRDEFLQDLWANYGEMRRFGIEARSATTFLPPFEWYNDSISRWCREAGFTLVNFTPGTYSNADYTTPDMGRQYVTSDTIVQRILAYERADPQGLNGFILLLHIGADPRRPDPMYKRLDDLLAALVERGYGFRRFAEP